MKRMLVLFFAATAAVVGCWFVFQNRPSLQLLSEFSSEIASPASSEAASDEPAAADAERVVALGWLEPVDGIIEVSAAAGDRLESIEVEEGAAVEEGQPLGYLESRSVRQDEWASLEAQLAEAEARRDAESKLADARIAAAAPAVEQAKLVDLEIEAQQSQIAALRAALEVARNDAKRLVPLSDQLVSAQQRERQKLVVEQREAELTAAQAVLERLTRARKLSLAAAEADLESLKRAKEQVLTAVPLESLKKRRDLAKTLWDETAVLAPSSGAVLKVFIQPGETIGRSPILYLADSSRMAAVAEVYETDVKRIQLGQAAKIASQAFHPPYDRQGLRGSVSQIGRIFAVPKLTSLDPLARADRHVVEVRIELDKKSSQEAARFVNLQVDVTFLADQ